MYPTLEKVKEIAASGEYRRIPVCKELYADRYTPVEVMRVLRKASKHCYLLESASQTEVWGRFSFLGYEPAMEITCTDGVLNIRKTGEDMVVTKKVEHPGDTLREIIEQYKTPVMEELPPFTGGLVGYFSYDYIKYSEQKLKLEDKEQQDFRDMDLMLFDQVIAFDHYRQKVLLIAGVMTDDLEASYQKAEGKLEEMAQLLKTGPHMEFEKLKLESDIRPQFPEAEYCKMVEKAKHYIREGDIFQVVLSNPMRAKATGNLFDTYRVLRATNPSPYMFYFSSDDIEIAGASPETLVKLEAGNLSTFPLAGTRPRGKTREEDRELEAGLLKDEKERAEHNMLVDLGRNDIGKISKIGSVKVEKYMCVEYFSHVMHLGSTVVGDLRWMPLMRSCRPEHSPEHRSSGPVRSSKNWNTANVASTVGRSVILILQEIWTPVSRFAWFIKRRAKSVFVPVPVSWRTAYRRKNLKNAATRHGPWFRQLHRHRRDWNDSTD